MTPELTQHLSDMQTLARQLETQLVALDGVFDSPQRREIALCLLSSVSEIARELDNGLDSATLMKVEAKQ